LIRKNLRWLSVSKAFQILDILIINYSQKTSPAKALKGRFFLEELLSISMSQWKIIRMLRLLETSKTRQNLKEQMKLNLVFRSLKF